MLCISLIYTKVLGKEAVQFIGINGFYIETNSLKAFPYKN